MLILRRIVFCGFVFLYIILCPLVVLYAFGYIFKPQGEELVVKTGIIHLSTAPAGAAVYVNGKVTQNKTPAMLDKLTPGSYVVRLALEGYEVWSDTLPVKAGEATTLDKILLTPNKRGVESVLVGNFDNLVYLNGTRFLLVSAGAALRNYIVYECAEKKDTMLVSAADKYADCETLSVFTARESGALLFSVRSDEAKNFFLWFDLCQKKPVPSNITNLFPEEPRWVMWEASDQENIFTFQTNSINRLDLGAKALYPAFARNVRGLGVAGRLVYVMASDGTLSAMNYEKRDAGKLLDDKKLADSIFGPSGDFRVIPFSKGVILFISENGGLLANRLPYKFVEEGVGGIGFDFPRERILLWQVDKVGVLDFSTEVTGAVSFEQGPRLDWIFTDGKNIKEAFWVYGASHVLFQDGDEVYLLGLCQYGGSHLHHVVTVKKKTGIFYLEETGLMYYIDRLNGNLASIEIIPGRSGAPEEDEV